MNIKERIDEWWNGRWEFLQPDQPDDPNDFVYACPARHKPSLFVRFLKGSIRFIQWLVKHIIAVISVVASGIAIYEFWV